MTRPRPARGIRGVAKAFHGSQMTDNQHEDVLAGVRRRVDRYRRWQREGEPSLARQFARVGVLGWLIVVPTLLGVALGRWLDRVFDSGVLFSGALLLLGLVLGCWSGWRWMHDA